MESSDLKDGSISDVMIVYGNLVPSSDGDVGVGRTTRTYGLPEIMKSVPCRRNSCLGSAAASSEDKT